MREIERFTCFFLCVWERIELSYILIFAWSVYNSTKSNGMQKRFNNNNKKKKNKNNNNNNNSNYAAGLVITKQNRNDDDDW